MRGYKLRLVSVLALVVLSLLYLSPLSGKKEKIRLGLDLKGGVYLALGVDLDKAVEADLDKYALILEDELKKAKVDVDTIERKGKEIHIKLLLKEDVPKVEKVIKDLGSLKIARAEGDTVVVVLSPKEVERIKKNALDQTLEVIRNRIDEFGVTEPEIRKAGHDRIIVQIPGIKDPERAIKIIGRTARLEFKLLDEEHSVEEALAGKIPPGDEILYGRVVDKQTGRVRKVPYLVKKQTLLTGDHLVDARVMIDSRTNEPYVAIKFDKIGTKIFAQITSKNVGKRLAIILDNTVYSAPVIREPITGGEASITGSFTFEEAHDLAIVLRAGALPAPVKILENRTVGPSLGIDSIRKGVRAAIVGLIVVVLFMAVYYRLAGVIADVALLLNMILILGALAAFNATLTLPGIAGIVLTIGMSVDANVLIFERIREELRLGRTIRAAIDAGFERATITILDANITTLIAALILFQYGTGPIKGFAVTLSIGIIASMFTAIVFCRGVFEMLVDVFKIKKLSI
ncbi:preprotein translocase subunit SecD [Thermosulfidibacter takaii ABI70S6]|uniref:Protein translocase subunit SecD n=1 Tax=Thermosulfidibacter takaii (strain DSM 17441 / JCM 13301 / NBRC 103674 / ABI70S6) TaxID=1298851 RepID=A0A0S3QSD1_THET7|nr:protein translocase subunit SecD [Thermosulfidibacter takaii]BAT71212.1 preprotein translocase subunit SecD [Thermosulfidibacter takaii ABI70S6]